MCTDGAYSKFEQHASNTWQIKNLKPHRKPRSGELSNAKTLENNAIGGFRVKVEHKFADSCHFAVVSLLFNFNEDIFNWEFKLGKYIVSKKHSYNSLVCAFMNINLQAKLLNIEQKDHAMFAVSQAFNLKSLDEENEDSNDSDNIIIDGEEEEGLYGYSFGETPHGEAPHNSYNYGILLVN